MNIAHILPYSAKFPLTKHNGRYEWVLRLAKLQVKNGHTVTIYSSPQSNGEGILWESLPADLGSKEQNNIALFNAAFSNHEHDIFHSHFDYLHYLVADSTTKPVVFTQHWFPNQKIADMQANNHSGNVVAVPVTEYMRGKDIELGIKSSNKIYHGIDLSLFQLPTSPRSDHLICLGRISPNKGVYEAVQIAIKSVSKLDIVGKVNQIDQQYWTSILPFVDGENIRYLGPQPQETVAKLLGQAKAYLFPSQQPEAFGQVTIEAQACGTPVIISSVGASNELIIDGATGFIARSEQDYIDAINKVTMIDSQTCRNFAEKFDINQMAINYDQLYKSLTLESEQAPN